MRTISFWFFIFALAILPGHAQDAATQQQLDKLSGQIQDVQDALALQNKRIAALEKRLDDLTDKVNTPVVNNSASLDDLKKLAAQVQELANKQQSDNDLIVKEIEKLGQAAAAPVHKSAVSAGTRDKSSGTKQTGYPYVIKSGNTLSAIAKAYNDNGVKVTVKDILEANPGLDANKLLVGQKIFIPDPSAK